MGGVTSTSTQVLSDDAVYEYRADRWWAEGPRLAFVGCNPSLITWQAGARLDPTSAKGPSRDRSRVRSGPFPCAATCSRRQRQRVDLWRTLTARRSPGATATPG